MRVLNREVVKFRLSKDSFFQYSTKYDLRNLRCPWECHTIWMGLMMWKRWKDSLKKINKLFSPSSLRK